ncbi:MAG: dihydroneopterin aldolase [Bacteroidales bacterium]|nr:dihydroneopterin aldolase [Bacteroidales bacterium]
MQTFIEIQNLRIHAFHGVLPQERIVGNMYQIDCIISTDYTKAMQSDALDDTISYADIVSIIEQEMATPSNLLEHVAGRIGKAIHNAYINRIEKIDLKIAKIKPPIQADIHACAIHVIM